MTRIRTLVDVSADISLVPSPIWAFRACGDEELSIFHVGSTTVFPYDNETLEAVELGASIFVKVNKNLWRAVDEFGLERVNFEGDDDDIMGIWDGQEFALTVSATSRLSGASLDPAVLDWWWELLQRLAGQD